MRRIYNSLLQRPDSDPTLTDWARKYVKENMRLTGVVQFTGPDTTESSWGTAARNRASTISIFHIGLSKAGFLDIRIRSKACSCPKLILSFCSER